MAQLLTAPAAAIAGSERVDLSPISISRAGAWASCAAKAFLRYNLKATTDYEAAHFTIGKAIHSGLEDYYKGHVASPKDGALNYLKAIFKENGVEGVFDRAAKVAEVDAKIIARFEAGEFKKKDGSLYTTPRMTNDYKKLSASTGLDKMKEDLGNVMLGKMKLPEGGVLELINRVTSLIEKYEKRLMIPRERFAELYIEQKFDFVTVTPSGREIRLLGYMDLVGKLTNGSWVLVDYKTGVAQAIEDHQASADSSLQLTLYEHVLHELWGIKREDLSVALHFLDACYEAPTFRGPEHMQYMLGLMDTYLDEEGKPGLVKRLFYDSKDCKGCEYRSACVNAFGMTGCATSAPKPKAPLATEVVEDDLASIWD